MSEALLFAEHGENMLCTKIVLNVRNNFCTQDVLPRFELGIFIYWTCNSMNNLSSYCGLVDEKIRASDKDLPVFPTLLFFRHPCHLVWARSGLKQDWSNFSVLMFILWLIRKKCAMYTVNAADSNVRKYRSSESMYVRTHVCSLCTLYTGCCYSTYQQ